jgi:hypothetical protein
MIIPDRFAFSRHIAITLLIMRTYKKYKEQTRMMIKSLTLLASKSRRRAAPGWITGDSITIR